MYSGWLDSANEYGAIFCDFRNTYSPKFGGKYIIHEKSLLITYRVENALRGAVKGWE